MPSLSHRSPGITAIYNEVKFSPANSVLDLGPMAASTFSFFSSHACKIHFENLNDFIEENLQATDAEKVDKLGQFLTQYKTHQKFDVIFTWDYLNYLSPECFKLLMKHLEPYCKPDTLVHLIRYTGHKIPLTPSHYRVQDQYLTQVDAVAEMIEHNQKQSVIRLLQSLPEFELQHSLIGKDGMQPWITEYVFRFKPSVNLRKQRVSNSESTAHDHHVDTITTRHSSPGLNTLFKKLSELEQQPKVLSLGIPNGFNQEQLLRKCRELHEENLIGRQIWTDNPTELKPEVLKFDETFKLDAVLLWYLPGLHSKEQFQLLMEQLKAHCTASTLFWCVAMTDARYQSLPVLLDGQELQLAMESTKKFDYQALNSSELMKRMVDFSLVEHHSFKPGMLAGLTEYLFTLRV